MSYGLVDQAFQEAIQQKIFSGAQVLLGRGEQRLFGKSYGTLTQGPQSPDVNPSTLFDIASLTKPVATASLAMLAVEEKLLSLEDPVAKFLPKFGRPEKLTLRQLLSHTSGLPDWLPLYRDVEGKAWTHDQVQEFFISQIDRIPLQHTPGQKRIYSDLGFILLGFILEKVFNSKLDKLWRERLASPLKMESTWFNPLSHPDRVELKNIAATEACPWRKKVLQGEVHDDNAYVLGGVAGHAGLFSTVTDLEKYALFILRTWSGGSLGWDTVTPPHSQAGRYFSPQDSIGHLAFTGCSLWIDFSDQKYIILLTNRVHPSRNNEGIKEFRPKVHDLLIEAIL